MKIIKKLLLFSLLIGFITVVYAFYIEPHRFVIHSETITLKENSTTTISIVQLSDTEIGTYYKEGNLQKHVEEINALSPDLIVFTGDLFNNYAKYGPYEEMQEILTKLKAKTGKYAVYGNKDYGGGAVRIYEQLMESSGFQVIRNEMLSLTIHRKQLQLVGLDSYLMGAFDEDTIHQQLSNDYTTIVLAHEPELIEKLSFSYDLILCGHTHGGQVAIPFLQQLFNISNTPYQKGLYRINDTTQAYIDSGMGTSRIPIRMLNPPQISYLKIKL